MNKYNKIEWWTLETLYIYMFLQIMGMIMYALPIIAHQQPNEEWLFKIPIMFTIMISFIYFIYIIEKRR